MRGLEWELKEGAVIIHQRNEGFYAKIAHRFFGTPETSYIRLDEFGSYVWQCIDGESTVHAIGIRVKEQFGREAEPLYERLSRFIETLKRVHYIEFTDIKKRKKV